MTENSFKKTRYNRKDEQGRRVHIIPVFENFHSMDVSEDCEYPAHTHNSYELVYICSGPYSCHLNDRLLCLNNREILLIKPGDRHEDHLQKNQFHYVLHFNLISQNHPALRTIPIFSEGTEPEQQIISGSTDWLLNFFEDLQRELELDDVSSFFLQDVLMEKVFWELVRCLAPSQLSSVIQQFGTACHFESRLLSYFEENLKSPLSIADMASNMNLSRRSLSLQCRKILGESPARLFFR